MAAYLLFVDDEASNLVVWEAAYAARFPVLTAGDGHRALELIRSHEVAVIISDQRMPGMSGVELLAKVQRESPNTVRVLITAHTDLSVAIDAINRGGVHRYLRKPCAIDELRAEVDDAMDVYALRAQARTVEQRLLLTERAYTLGLEAAGIGHSLGRPVESIRQRIMNARTEVHAIAAERDPVAGEMSMLSRQLDSLEERLGAALAGVERLMTLARDDDARPTASGGELVDVLAVLQLALSTMAMDPHREVGVSLELHAVPLALGSGRQLSQVVVSLLVDALDAVSSLPRVQRDVTVRLASEGNQVLLEVLDNRPYDLTLESARGLDRRVPSVADGAAPSTLTLAAALVKEMGGELHRARTESNHGSYRVVLRAAPHPPTRS